MKTIGFLVMVVCAGCLPPAARTNPFDRAGVEAVIYAAVIDTLFAEHSPQRLIVKRGTAGGPGRWESLSKDSYLQSRGVQQEAIRDFIDANQSVQPMGEIAATRMQLEFVADSVFSNLPAAARPVTRGEDPLPFWRAFYERFEGSAGFVRMTRPGFSPDRSQAFIAVTTACGSLCATGYHIVLAKQRGRWRVVQLIQTVSA